MKYQIRNAHTVKLLNLQSIDTNDPSLKYPYLKGIALESYQNKKPQILIGIDNGSLRLLREYHEGNDREPITTKTKLGWIFHGVLNNNYLESVNNSSYHQHKVINTWGIISKPHRNKKGKCI